jgi:SAM-dependent methyltransferase
MPLLGRLGELRRRAKAALWKRAGRSPDSAWAGAAKWAAIEQSIRSAPNGRFGYDDAGLDERVVEYPWLFERLAALKPDGRVLDAGSVLNYERVLRAWHEKRLPPVSIVTLGHEGQAFVSDRVRYEFADLRDLPYRDGSFSLSLSLSTLEHVGLDNAIYGDAAGAAPRSNPATEAGKALDEIGRVTRRGGTLLLSVPYGARSNRGWFRIFDADELQQLIARPGWKDRRVRYFRAVRDGWRECQASEASDAGYNEPRGGQRTAPPFVAAAEAVALVEMTRD